MHLICFCTPVRLSDSDCRIYVGLYTSRFMCVNRLRLVNMVWSCSSCIPFVVISRAPFEVNILLSVSISYQTTEVMHTTP